MSTLNGEHKREAMFSTVSNGNIRCGLCFRNCLILPNKTGYCKTRINKEGRLYSLMYGILSKLSIDPIEAKPFRHFHPGTRCLSIGTYGCNFRCKGCQNVSVSWGSDELPKIHRGRMESSVFIPPDIVVQTAKELCCDGIAFTYNEPAMWLEYVVDVARVAKQRDLYTVYVTNSSLSIKSIDVLSECIDAIATDIKSTRDSFYARVCSAPRVVNKILESIEHAKQKGIHIETRTNVIPGLNDQEEVFYEISSWIKEKLGSDSPWHITKFYPANELKDVPPTPQSVLEKAFRIAKECGLENVYLEDKPCDCAQGNIPKQIKDVLVKYQRNGVIISESVLNEGEGLLECPCCVNDQVVA